MYAPGIIDYDVSGRCVVFLIVYNMDGYTGADQKDFQEFVAMGRTDGIKWMRILFADGYQVGNLV